MIKNERQLGVARTKLDALGNSRSATDDKVSWRSYTDLIDSLMAAIADYEAVKGGHLQAFALDGLDSVGEAIIKARISRGWTQKHLSEVLGVSEQQVQRDESRDYENAQLSRLAELIDALDFELVGTLKRKGTGIPTPAPENGSSMSTSLAATIPNPRYGEVPVPEQRGTAWLYLTGSLKSTSKDRAECFPNHLQGQRNHR